MMHLQYHCAEWREGDILRSLLIHTLQTTMEEKIHALVRGGAETASNVIKEDTRAAYQAYFRKFAEFCVLNEIPDPRLTRHYNLPTMLVAYLKSISKLPSVSLQTAEKTRSAVSNHFSAFVNSDGTNSNVWIVKEDSAGNKHGYGNLARHAFVQQFMRGLT